MAGKRQVPKFSGLIKTGVVSSDVDEHNEGDPPVYLTVQASRPAKQNAVVEETKPLATTPAPDGQEAPIPQAFLMKNLKPASEESEVDIPISEIDLSPFQPRIKIDEDALRRLAESIDADGQINPIVVRRKSDGRYELVGGERRFRAAMLLKRTLIKAIVKTLKDADAAVMALADNDAREDLTDFERGRKYKQLLDEKIVASQSELARRTGKERTFIVRCLSFFRLPVEAIPLLEQKPGFIGAVNAGVFASAMEKNNGGDADLVLDAIKKIFDEKLDAANAINWMKGQVRSRHYPTAPKVHQEWTSAGRRLGDVKIEGRKLVISCADGVTPNELMNLLLLAEVKL